MFSFVRSTLIGVLIAAMAGSGCSSPTTPSSSTSGTTITFASRLLVGGSAWRSFVQTSVGIVTLHLTVLSPDTEVAVQVGIGTWDGTTCTPTNTAVATSTDTDPELSVLLTPGRYCVLIADIGNLTVMNDFAIVLVQP
jgi:hypothetical protein